MTGRSSVSSAIRAVAPLLFLIALVTAITLLATLGSPSFRSTVQVGLVNLIAVVGIYIFVGNSGVLSFGHISFMAIGAYTFALLTIPPLVKEGLIPSAPGLFANAELGVVPAAFIAGLAAAVFALILSGPLMRLSGLAAGIATLAVLVIVNIVIANADSVTGGRNTLVGVPTQDGPLQTLPWVAVALIIAYAFQVSRFGVRLRASREDAPAARSIGISITRERALAFVLSAFVVGFGGAAYASALGSISADTFYLDLTFLTLAMLIVGGIHSLGGAVVGTAVVTLVSEVLRQIEDGVNILGLTITGRSGLREVGLALVLLAILILRPGGIMGSSEPTWPPRSLHRLGRGELGPAPARPDAGRAIVREAEEVGR